MIIIPAIDLKDGCVVRLLQGKFDAQKTYSRDPLKVAKHWAAQGARMLHVVDLDGARTGKPLNLERAKAIARAVKIPVELGGGIREITAIKELLNSGISRVVLGTRAVEDKAFLKKAFSLFKDRIIVSIDVKNGVIATKGWQAGLKGESPEDAALFLKSTGFKEFIYTDTLKDGTLSGPNIKDLKALLKATGMRVIASGGVSSLSDILKLKSLKNIGLSGVVVGKALYEGKFTLKEALKL